MTKFGFGSCKWTFLATPRVCDSHVNFAVNNHGKERRGENPALQWRSTFLFKLLNVFGSCEEVSRTYVDHAYVAHSRLRCGRMKKAKTNEILSAEKFSFGFAVNFPFGDFYARRKWRRFGSNCVGWRRCSLNLLEKMHGSSDSITSPIPPLTVGCHDLFKKSFHFAFFPLSQANHAKKGEVFSLIFCARIFSPRYDMHTKQSFSPTKFMAPIMAFRCFIFGYITMPKYPSKVRDWFQRRSKRYIGRFFLPPSSSSSSSCWAERKADTPRKVRSISSWSFVVLATNEARSSKRFWVTLFLYFKTAEKETTWVPTLIFLRFEKFASGFISIIVSPWKETRKKFFFEYPKIVFGKRRRNSFEVTR